MSARGTGNPVQRRGRRCAKVPVDRWWAGRSTNARLSHRDTRRGDFTLRPKDVRRRIGRQGLRAYSRYRRGCKL